MPCQKVKNLTDKYLAGKCQPFETQFIEKHIALCASCAAELEEMKSLHNLLNKWQAGPAPGGLWADVMAGVAEISQAASRPPANSRRYFGHVLRDLVAAAAVALVLVWNTVPLLGEGQVAAAGKTISSISAAYIQAADKAMERAAGTAGQYSYKFFNEELKQK